MAFSDKTPPVVLREPGRPAPPTPTQDTSTMKCPIDNEILVITSRDGIEIDYCPKCRGVWLDRGELDKIIERAAPPPPPPREQYDRGHQGRDEYDEHDEHDERDERYRDQRGRKPYRKKRSSILSELFDF